MKFGQALPVIKDSDPDTEQHMRAIQSILDCQSFGKKGARDLDKLVIFKRALATGSVRFKVYEAAIERAYKYGRLPQQAREVYEEIVKKLRAIIRETLIQCQERVDREFEALMMSRSSHAAFRVS